MNILRTNTTPLPTFGNVSWCDSDLENALDLAEVPVTPDNIHELFYEIDEDSLMETMIQAGWDYIYEVRDDLIRRGILKYEE